MDSTIDWKENQLTKRVKSQSELTELKARDTSCPRGKKVELKIIRTIGIFRSKDMTTIVQLRPLEHSDREQFVLDNQEAFNYGALEELGHRN